MTGYYVCSPHLEVLFYFDYTGIVDWLSFAVMVVQVV